MPCLIVKLRPQHLMARELCNKRNQVITKTFVTLSKLKKYDTAMIIAGICGVHMAGNIGGEGLNLKISQIEKLKAG